ncbi:hypothetical protein DdX_16826 [Ditylenchus destructor]|uniref:Uncharacterized protein n=1 Tax=Ditylenchus destructor TaxID=166010 RepID=A0AAD4MPS2_9BILA|nr:hypothetical protein DdX_16826 [Ditylenchus destructor]
MNDTQLFALMSVICVIVSYSTNVGADPPDPKQNTSAPDMDSGSTTMAIPRSLYGRSLATEATSIPVDESFNHTIRRRHCLEEMGKPPSPPQFDKGPPPPPDKPPSSFGPPPPPGWMHKGLDDKEFGKPPSPPQFDKGPPPPPGKELEITQEHSARTTTEAEISINGIKSATSKTEESTTSPKTTLIVNGTKEGQIVGGISTDINADVQIGFGKDSKITQSTPDLYPPTDSESITAVGDIVAKSMATSETDKTKTPVEDITKKLITMGSDAKEISSKTTASSIDPISIDSTITMDSSKSTIKNSNVGADFSDAKQKFKDTGIGSTFSLSLKILLDGEIKDKFDKLENQDVMDIMEVLGQSFKFKDVNELLSKLSEKNSEAANFVKLLLKKMGCSEDNATMNCKASMDKIKQMISKIKLIMDTLVQYKLQIMFGLTASMSVMQNTDMASKIMQFLIGLYSINIGADFSDPKQKFKDTKIGSLISNLLPPGEVKEKFDKLEVQDVMDMMEMLGQAYKMKDLDELLGKLYEKNPEAAKFVKTVLASFGCSPDDATKTCVPSMDKIKQMIAQIKPMMDKLSQNKDQIMGGLSVAMSVVSNADMVSKITQSLTS